MSHAQNIPLSHKSKWPDHLSYNCHVQAPKCSVSNIITYRSNLKNHGTRTRPVPAGFGILETGFESNQSHRFNSVWSNFVVKIYAPSYQLHGCCRVCSPDLSYGVINKNKSCNAGSTYLKKASFVHSEIYSTHWKNCPSPTSDLESESNPTDSATVDVQK